MGNEIIVDPAVDPEPLQPSFKVWSDEFYEQEDHVIAISISTYIQAAEAYLDAAIKNPRRKEFMTRYSIRMFVREQDLDVSKVLAAPIHEFRVLCNLRPEFTLEEV